MVIFTLHEFNPVSLHVSQSKKVIKDYCLNSETESMEILKIHGNISLSLSVRSQDEKPFSLYEIMTTVPVPLIENYKKCFMLCTINKVKCNCCPVLFS